MELRHTISEYSSQQHREHYFSTEIVRVTVRQFPEIDNTRIYHITIEDSVSSAAGLNASLVTIKST